MAVAFDAQSVADTVNSAGSISSVTIAAGNANNITIGSGANRAVVFLVTIANFAGTSPTISSVVWDGPGTNQSAAVITGTNAQVTFAGTVLDNELWGLVAPTSGNKQLTVTFSGALAASADVYIAAVSYTGVDQTGGATTFAHGTNNNGSGTTPSIAVTSATANAVVAVWNTSSAAITSTTASTTNTQVYIDNTGSVSASAGNRATGASSVTMGLTLTNNWIGSGVDVVAATSGDTLGGAMPLLMMSRRRRDPVKTLLVPSRYRRRMVRGFALAA